jgi:cytochrome b561
MRLHNTQTGYGAIARALHWWMAAIMIGLIGLGLYMTGQPDGDPKWRLYDLHKSFGAIVFLLALARVAWRHASPPPPLPTTLSTTDRRAAHAGHLLLYAAMFALPVTGYLDASLGGYHLNLFGLFEVPMLLAKDEALFELIVLAHRWIGYALGLLVIAHVGAALKHHFVNRDGVLTRMLRGAPQSSE